MGKRDFTDYICHPFCIFFRKGVKEDLACQAAEVVEQLIKLGRLDREQLPRQRKNLSGWEKHDPILDDRVCHHCTFKTKDCEFQSKNPSLAVDPCGGYILLTLLKRDGIITPADLEEIAAE